MGAEVFMCTMRGRTPREAFAEAVREARYAHGHGGYSGTIAEKRSFTMIDLPDGAAPRAFVNDLIDRGDDRVDDKWGPAGCVDLGPVPEEPELRRYLFFGWASS